MPDDLLRGLERRWRSPRDPRDEAAVRRAGVTNPARLALAAALGLRGEAAIGVEPERWPEDPRAWGRLHQVALLIAPDESAATVFMAHLWPVTRGEAVDVFGEDAREAREVHEALQAVGRWALGDGDERLESLAARDPGAAQA